ncbi:hypothetical protein NP233_g8236 [Leucocoprinus birnbaumii]|uniref:Uncharacterized protein n=1 Tax=Leucocoprinus birnbaumii TaxID=56174 RepID=A0AAD5YNC1_9AGAR|nr:hypothetical protein NP233_g8236 [Leucocoprinus birnbaumii]
MRFHTHSIPVNEFLWFVFCMRDAGMRAEFLRVQPLSPLDRDLINACGSLVRPLDFETELPAELTNLSNHGEAGYILLGFPTDPVLCIIVEEAITLYTHADLEELL